MPPSRRKGPSTWSISAGLKAYDDDVLKNLLNGWFMHIAIHAKNLKELADKKGQFIAIYRGFLLSLKDK